MATLQTYEIASRRHKSVVAIPWAEPAPLTAQGYPAFLEPIHLKRKELKRNLLEVELDQFTTLFSLSGFYPGSTLAESNRIRFDVSRQDLPELNEFPAIDLFALSGFYPGSGLAESNKIEYKVTIQQLPQLDQFTPTPGLLAGFYPGSALAKSFKSSYKTNLLTVPELDTYPATPIPEQPFTAYLEQPYFIRQEKRQALTLPELNSYPQPVLSPALLAAFFKIDILFRRDVNRGLLELALMPPPVIAPVVPVVDVWTVQPDSVTSWSAQSDSSTTWTEQADSSTTWTEQ